nr:putative holin-like toxin [Lactobacillus helveticus]
MLLFGMFVLALLTYIDHHDKKIKTPLNLITLEELLSSVHRKK